MTQYNKRDVFTHEDYLNTAADLKEHNEYITETAGYIPLEVKLKQFEQNGVIAQFQQSDFTSHDYREMYLNPDFDITPEDDFEEVEEKIKAKNEFILQYQKSKVGSFEKTADSPSDSAAAQTEEKQKEE